MMYNYHHRWKMFQARTGNKRNRCSYRDHIHIQRMNLILLKQQFLVDIIGRRSLLVRNILLHIIRNHLWCYWVGYQLDNRYNGMLESWKFDLVNMLGTLL